MRGRCGGDGDQPAVFMQHTPATYCRSVLLPQRGAAHLLCSVFACARSPTSSHAPPPSSSTTSSSSSSSSSSPPPFSAERDPCELIRDPDPIYEPSAIPTLCTPLPPPPPLPSPAGTTASPNAGCRRACTCCLRTCQIRNAASDASACSHATSQCLCVRRRSGVAAVAGGGGAVAGGGAGRTSEGWANAEGGLTRRGGDGRVQWRTRAQSPVTAHDSPWPPIK